MQLGIRANLGSASQATGPAFFTPRPEAVRCDLHLASWLVSGWSFGSIFNQIDSQAATYVRKMPLHSGMLPDIKKP